MRIVSLLFRSPLLLARPAFVCFCLRAGAQPYEKTMLTIKGSHEFGFSDPGFKIPRRKLTTYATNFAASSGENGRSGAPSFPYEIIWKGPLC